MWKLKASIDGIRTNGGTYFMTQNAVHLNNLWLQELLGPTFLRRKISAHSFIVVRTADTTSALQRFIESTADLYD
jgi:hypothetical protein